MKDFPLTWISEYTMSEFSLSNSFYTLWHKKVFHNKYIETLPIILSLWRKKEVRQGIAIFRDSEHWTKNVFTSAWSWRSFFVVSFAYLGSVLPYFLRHRISDKVVSIIHTINHALKIGNNLHERRVHGR